MINRSFFFENVKAHLFNGKLNVKQSAGLTHILDVWEAKYSKKDDRWLAYALGTAHHEVDRTMQPIHEYGGKSYFMKRYDITGANPKLAEKLGNTEVGDGALFHGRGFVQLTGRTNYRKMQKFLDVDLTSSESAANRVLDLKNASAIMFKGMMDGDFTGKKFSDYFSQIKDDWINARRIINGKDKANIIADYAKRYYSAISYTTA